MHKSSKKPQSDITQQKTDKNSSRTVTLPCGHKKVIAAKPPDQADSNNSSAALKKVTDDLVSIIKNMQQQLRTIPGDQLVPSDVLEPKSKEFFKNSETTNNNNNTSTSDNNVSNSSKISTKSCVSTGSTEAQRFLKTIRTPNADPLKMLKQEVERAMKMHKTFTVRGPYPAVRSALLRRGWVERLHISYQHQMPEHTKKLYTYTVQELLPMLKDQELTEICCTLIKSKLMGTHQVDLFYASDDSFYKDKTNNTGKITMINKLKRQGFSYTTKQGLSETAQNYHWYHIPNVACFKYPRSYSVNAKNDPKEFVDDFHATAAMSLLKWIVYNSTAKESKLLSAYGLVPMEAFDFAINECCKFIKSRNHDDIDIVLPQASCYEWDTFIEFYYKIVHFNNHFKADNKKVTEDVMVAKSKYILGELGKCFSDLSIDGFRNVWILKPLAASRGRGIHICRYLKNIMNIVRDNNNRYVVQKYLERPLLIYNTKFDIRQWFLISSTSPLTIWMYKECYLRFSSQTYNLRKLHESIHITNNSVQCRYQSKNVDGGCIPNYNMWDKWELIKYLTKIGYPNVYKQKIYPGMKQCIIAAILMHQDRLVERKRAFELHGADLMLSEDFEPYLIEINANPAMNKSTPVTRRLCPRVLEDMIKVVVDRPYNNKADTGAFELIYQQKMTQLPSFDGKMEVIGRALDSTYFFTPPESDNAVKHKKKIDENSVIGRIKPLLKTYSDEMKNTLKNLLHLIQQEKVKRAALLKPSTVKTDQQTVKT